VKKTIDQLKRSPFLVKAFLLMFLISLTFVIFYLAFGFDYQEAKKTSHVTKENLLEEIYLSVVKAPIVEEILYRGPAYLLLIFILILSKILSRRYSRPSIFEQPLFWKITLTDIYVWPVVLIPNYFWTIAHSYPWPLLLQIFTYGLIWGWLMIKTRNILYNILIHSACNALALIGSLIMGVLN